MIFIIDQFDALSRLLVLHILILQHILHGFEFFSHTQFTALDQMRIKDRDTAKIY